MIRSIISKVLVTYDIGGAYGGAANVKPLGYDSVENKLIINLKPIYGDDHSKSDIEDFENSIPDCVKCIRFSFFRKTEYLINKNIDVVKIRIKNKDFIFKCLLSLEAGALKVDLLEIIKLS